MMGLPETVATPIIIFGWLFSTLTLKEKRPIGIKGSLYIMSRLLIFIFVGILLVFIGLCTANPFLTYAVHAPLGPKSENQHCRGSF